MQVLWAKGYTELLERMQEHTVRTGENVLVDVYGSGPDLQVSYLGGGLSTVYFRLFD
jgi:hypothetical protein